MVKDVRGEQRSDGFADDKTETRIRVNENERVKHKPGRWFNISAGRGGYMQQEKIE